MSEWIESPLEELVSFQKGKNVDTIAYPLPGYKPYIGAGALEGNGHYYANGMLSVTADKNDVLMLWDGERSGLVGHNLEGVVSSTVAKLTPNNKIEPAFLYYSLLNSFDWIQHRRTGTGVPHVPKDLGRILVLRFPESNKVQNKIAHILSTVDLAVEKTEALIEKYRKIKNGLMHDLFTRGIGKDGKLRPPRSEAPELYKKTSVGWIPKEWDICTMDSIKESLIDGPFGTNLKTEHYVVDPGIRVVRLQNILPTLYNDNDKAYISTEHANNLVRNKVFYGDILIAGLGEEKYPVGRACIYPKNLTPAVNKADCFRLRSDRTKMDNTFLMYFLNTPIAKKQVRSYEQGVTRPRINLGNLKRIFVSVPELKEQNRIGQKLTIFTSKIEVEQKALNKLQKTKSGLMNDLLTGKVEVSVKEKEPANV